MKIKTALLAAAALAVGATGGAAAQEKSTLQVVRGCGFLNCQVAQPGPGFYRPDDTGDRSGHDVAFCRAVAAAVLGDASKVEFQSVSSQARFTSLADGESDMLSRTATWTAAPSLASISPPSPSMTVRDFWSKRGAPSSPSACSRRPTWRKWRAAGCRPCRGAVRSGGSHGPRFLEDDKPDRDVPGPEADEQRR